MTRAEFHALRDLPGKRITEDIIFKPASQHSGSVTFDNVKVENELGFDVILNGTYKPQVPTVTFNFSIRPEGSICRLCVNGTCHGNAGRTHKHDLRGADDQRANLPTAFARPDLENLSPRQVWDHTPPRSKNHPRREIHRSMTSALTCDSLAPILRSFSLVRKCDTVRDGSIRISTPFHYPNGSLIDVFLSRSAQPTFEGDEFTISDLGQTTDYLLDLQFKHWTTSRRKQLVSDICKSLGVVHDAGAFKINFGASKYSEIPEYLVRIAQACIRVTDVAFTQRFRTASVFAENVEEFISSTQTPYEAGIVVPGRFGKDVIVDFRVKGKNVESLIQTISASSSASNLATHEAFIKWHDLGNLRDSLRFLTVYDSSCDFRPEDISRLGEVSEIVAFPVEENRLRETLVA